MIINEEMRQRILNVYDCTQISRGKITYNRKKVRNRRKDKAEMVVDVLPEIQPLVAKYRDRTGKRVFNFYRTYYNESAFNKAINKGLKTVGELLNIEDLEFYAARHSWATIALNDCGIDKYTVHECLNHVDQSM